MQAGVLQVRRRSPAFPAATIVGGQRRPPTVRIEPNHEPGALRRRKEQGNGKESHRLFEAAGAGGGRKPPPPPRPPPPPPPAPPPGNLPDHQHPHPTNDEEPAPP